MCIHAYIYTYRQIDPIKMSDKSSSQYLLILFLVTHPFLISIFDINTNLFNWKEKIVICVLVRFSNIFWKSKNRHGTHYFRHTYIHTYIHKWYVRIYVHACIHICVQTDPNCSDALKRTVCAPDRLAMGKTPDRHKVEVRKKYRPRRFMISDISIKWRWN